MQFDVWSTLEDTREDLLAVRAVIGLRSLPAMTQAIVPSTMALESRWCSAMMRGPVSASACCGASSAYAIIGRNSRTVWRWRSPDAGAHLEVRAKQQKSPNHLLVGRRHGCHRWGVLGCLRLFFFHA